MSENLNDAGSPTVEVRVYRDGELLARELCESDVEAAAVAEAWQERPGITVLVDDLAFQHGPDDILAPEPAVVDDEERFGD